jgi:N-acetylglucosaminyl-diphospho-decaprenol L-rhamnosyltransferase
VLGTVVVSYGSAELLRAHLASADLSAMRTATVVVVVDNFRSVPAQDEVRRCAEEHGWTLLLNSTNRGFGAAANQGVDRALALGCTAVVVVNPDVDVDGGLLDALAEEAGRRPRSLVSPRLVRPDGRPWFTGGGMDLRRGWTLNRVQDAEPRSDGWLTGACLAASADLWRDLGGFDEDYFLYWEDVDLSFRCTQAGGTLVVRADLEAVHDVGGTQAAVGKSAVYCRYNCRNRLLFAAKHLGWRAVCRWLVHAPAYARRVLLRGGRRQLVRSPGLVWAAVRGSCGGAALAARSALPTAVRS